MQPVLLSICIPTYNRSPYLRECLESIVKSIGRHESSVEIVVSDNASSDDTGEVANAYTRMYKFIRYNRNHSNVGAERNFYTSIALASGETVWVIGDDDKISEDAVDEVLRLIRLGYSAIVCNYSVWSRDYSRLIKKYAWSVKEEGAVDDANLLMERFGPHLGYVSSVVLNRQKFMSVPREEYDLYEPYGFSFLYAFYIAVRNECKVFYVSRPLVLNRSGNSTITDWYKYFVIGTAVVFDALHKKGYSARAILTAKHIVLRDFLLRHMLSHKMRGVLRKELVMHATMPHYRNNWFLWFVCYPILYLPDVLFKIIGSLSGRMSAKR